MWLLPEITIFKHLAFCLLLKNDSNAPKTQALLRLKVPYKDCDRNCYMHLPIQLPLALLYEQSTDLILAKRMHFLAFLWLGEMAGLTNNRGFWICVVGGAIRL